MRLSTHDDIWEFIRETLLPAVDEVMRTVEEHGRWERDRLALASARWVLKTMGTRFKEAVYDD